MVCSLEMTERCEMNGPEMWLEMKKDGGYADLGLTTTGLGEKKWDSLESDVPAPAGVK